MLLALAVAYKARKYSFLVSQASCCAWADLLSLPSANAQKLFFMVTPDSSLAPRRRSSRTFYLGPNGQETPLCEQAAMFILQSYQLKTNGFLVSTSLDEATANFAISAQQGSITTDFSVTAGYLLWSNVAFSNGSASFCVLDNTVSAVFRGPAPSGCSPVLLLATFGGN